MVHREPQLHHHVKYWIKPDLENRIKHGEIEAYFNSSVQEIGIDHVVIQTPEGPIRLKNDFVLALIGYHPDYDFLRSMGIELSEQQCRPVRRRECMRRSSFVTATRAAGAAKGSARPCRR